MVPTGKIIRPPRATIREHEMQTVLALARHGHSVELIDKSETPHAKSADILMDGVLWEIKSPRSGALRQLEKNLKRASKQSRYVIIDSQRIAKQPDEKIMTFLRKQLTAQPGVIRRLLFVNKRRQIIDITAAGTIK